MNEVALTILEQLGGTEFVRMVGANTFVTSEIGVRFHYNGGKTKTCAVCLTPDDLYNVEFYNLTRDGEIKNRRSHEGIFCDMLQDLFEEETGLFVTLHPRKK